MATICLHKVLKLQKFAFNSYVKQNFNQKSLSILACASKKYRGDSNLTAISSHNENFGRNDNSLSVFVPKSSKQFGNSVAKFSSTSKSAEGTENTKITLEEFRAREQKREEEFDRNQQQHETQTEEDKTAKVDHIKLQILDASLQFVSSHGWTKKSLSHGAEYLGYPGVAHGMFPNGGFELIRHFYGKCNEDLLEYLKNETNNGELKFDDPIEFIVKAVIFRLQMIEPYISQWPQSLAVMSLPQNVQTSLAQLLTMVDDICYFAGDRSVEFKWYVRRVGLATIFKLTELFMLQDSSIDHQETWIFLRRRMEEAHGLENILLNTGDIGQSFPATLGSAFTTARNILGLDFKRR